MASKKIERALQLAKQTEFLEIGEHILNEVPKVFATHFPNKKGIVVADDKTYKIAGQEIRTAMNQAGLEGGDPLILDDPDLYANYDFVQKVKHFLENQEAIGIAVGSGVINDLTKLASYELGRPYMCVGTAASMDGYTAFGASITKNGAKQTMACNAPLGVLIDLEIVSKAPYINNASGYADLYAKVTAGADWILADALQVEAINGDAWHIVQDGLEEALRDPDGVRKGEIKAVRALIEGLILGGFAMQSMGSSRPASGAEHQFSHTWDMEHHTFNGEVARKFGLYKNKDEQAPSHGLKVGIGTLTITALYEQVLNTPLERLDVEKAVQNWKPLDQQIKEAQSLFADEGIKKFVEAQITGKYIDKDALRKQLTLLKNNWEEIQSKLKSQLIPYTETKKRLEAVGAPTTGEQIGIPTDRLKKTFYKAQKLRSRFTILDVAVRTGYMDQWVEALFEEGGKLA